MRIRSLGKLGKRVFYTLTVSTVFIIITVILSVIAIRSYLNENILGQRALDHIEESSNHLYRSLIDQETGVRGYHLTNDETFLEPFYYGLEEFEVSKSELTQYIGKFPSLSDNVKLFIEKGESWENLYGVSLIEMINSGNQPTLQQIREGKVALDEFRTNFSDFNEQIEAERTIVRNKMQNGIKNTLITLVSVIVVIVICILFLHIQLLKSVINPIIRLNSCVKSYTQHDFSTNVPEYKKNDELFELIRNVDIMRNKLSNKISHLKAKVNVDPLTGLYNRRYLSDCVHKCWELAKQQQYHFSIIIIDIDFYKNFNDTYGHLMGDECLRKVACCLQSIVCEPNCFVARYGGEEFSIIMLHEKEEEALVIAERIRKAIEQLEIKHETSLIHNVVTVSSGVVTLVPKGELQLEEVFSKADKALYESKQKGRNQVIKYILA